MSAKTDYATDTSRVVKLLKKKGRTWAKDLDTNVETMKFLEAAGIVRADGTIKTGKPGKPPVAWVLVDGADLSNLPQMEVAETRTRVEVTQETIDTVITEVQGTSYAKGCHCIVQMGPGTSLETIRSMGLGDDECNEGGKYVCPALDAVRRRAKTTRPEVAFQEVV